MRRRNSWRHVIVVPIKENGTYFHSVLRSRKNLIIFTRCFSLIKVRADIWVNHRRDFEKKKKGKGRKLIPLSGVITFLFVSRRENLWGCAEQTLIKDIKVRAELNKYNKDKCDYFSYFLSYSSCLNFSSKLLTKMYVFSRGHWPREIHCINFDHMFANVDYVFS